MKSSIKTTFLLGNFALILLLSHSAPALATERAADRDKRQRKKVKLLPPSTQLKPADSRPRYQIELSIDFEAGSLTGRALVDYTNNSSDSLGEIYFHLYPNAVDSSKRQDAGPDVSSIEPLLKVTEAKINNEPAQFSSFGATLQVELPFKLKAGETVEIELSFVGTVPPARPEETTLLSHITRQIAAALSNERQVRQGSDTFFSCNDTMLLSSAYPILAVQQGNKWQETVELSVGDIMFTEAADYQVRIDAPSGFKVITSGPYLVESNDGVRQVVKSSAEALRDFAIVLLKNYNHLARRVGNVEVNSYFRKQDTVVGKRSLNIAARALEVYQERFGSYPYPQLNIVGAPLAGGIAGVVFSGIVVLANAYYIDFQSPEIMRLPQLVREHGPLVENTLEFTLVHEVAHQWWGGAVGNDPGQHSFLDEALASYSAVVYYEMAYSPRIAAEQIQQQFRNTYRVYRSFGGSDYKVDRSASDFRNAFQYMAIVYAKGALFLAELRRLLGDDLFFRSLSRYFEENRFKVVTPREFLRAFTVEDQSKQQVARLYQQWIKERRGDIQIGPPEYRVVISRDVKLGDRSNASNFERLGRFFLRQLSKVGRATAKPF